MRLALLLVQAALSQLLSFALRPAISYALIDLGYSGAWLGVATAAYAVPSLLLAIPSGRWTDRLGERFSTATGAIAFTLASLLLLIADRSLWVLLGASALLGLGILFCMVGLQTWIARNASPQRLDASFGLYGLANSIGQVVGPLLLLLGGADGTGGASAAGADGTGGASIPTVVAALAASALLLVLTATLRPSPRTGRPTESMLHATGGLLRRRGIVKALIAGSLTLASLDILIAYLPMLAVERGFEAGWVTTVLIARGAATMLSRLTLSTLTRRFGRRAVIVTGSGLTAAACACFALPLGPGPLIAAGVVYGLASGTVQPLTMSWMTLLTPTHLRGIGVSLRMLGNRVGQTTIPLAVGGLSAVGGSAVVFAAAAAGLVIVTVSARSAPGDPAPPDEARGAE